MGNAVAADVGVLLKVIKLMFISQRKQKLKAGAYAQSMQQSLKINYLKEGDKMSLSEELMVIEELEEEEEAELCGFTCGLTGVVTTSV